jgi:hypothetical protein
VAELPTLTVTIACEWQMLVRDWAVMIIVNNLVAPNTIELSATRINVIGMVEKRGMRVVHRSDCRAAKLFPCNGYQADQLRNSCG